MEKTYLMKLPADVLYDIVANYLSLDDIRNLCSNSELFYKRYCTREYSYSLPPPCLDDKDNNPSSPPPSPSYCYHRSLWTEHLFKRLIMSDTSGINNSLPRLEVYNSMDINLVYSKLFEEVFNRLDTYNLDDNLLWSYEMGYDVLGEYLLNRGANIFIFLSRLSSKPQLCSRICKRLDPNTWETSDVSFRTIQLPYRPICFNPNTNIFTNFILPFMAMNYPGSTYLYDNVAYIIPLTSNMIAITLTFLPPRPNPIPILARRATRVARDAALGLTLLA